MSARAWTAGPWRALNTIPGADIEAANGRMIANAYPGSCRDSNAHLIAVAPELFEELESTTDAIERMAMRLDAEPGNQTVVALWMALVARNREVLAKALGPPKETQR